MTVTRVSPLTRTPNSHHYHCLISSLRSVLFCSHFISSSPSKSASEIDPFVVLLRESRRRRRGFHLFEPKGRKEGRREGRRLQVAKCICRRNRARPSCSQPESPFPSLPFSFLPCLPRRRSDWVPRVCSACSSALSLLALGAASSKAFAAAAI